MRTGAAFRRGKRGVALGAAAGVLAASVLGYAPGWAMTEAEDAAPPAPAATSGPAATAPAAETGSAGLSEEGLADAVRRDLGLTPEQFNAAGELGSRAAAAASRLRGVPGYTGIRLQDNRIIVSGTGAELRSAVDRLSGSLAGLNLEAPGSSASQPAPAPVPAATAAPGSQIAVSTEQLFQAYLREVGTAGLQAVVYSGGKFVIRTGSIAAAQATQGTGGAPSTPPGTLDTTAAPGKISPSEFVARYANVVLDGGAPLKPEADVPGGVGYQTDKGVICSTGFSAFDPSGLPAVLTAGHCTGDGAATTADLLLQGVPAGPLGAFEFSQLGGPGNSRVLDPNIPTNQDGAALEDPGNVGTDIAVVGALSPEQDPVPAASTHGDTLQPGPDVKIIGTASPVVGMEVCRSGWRTGWSCGTVSAVGIFLVGGPAYPADPADVRAFNGFLSYDVQSSGGDSGGPWISGNYAVGTHSAGDDPQPNEPPPPNFAVAATLEESLEVLPGYQLELFLNKPLVSSPAPGGAYEPGQVVSGTVPAAPASAVAAGSAVRITLQGQEPFEVPVNADGSWSFTAPDGGQTLRFTAETVNGFSVSGAADFGFAPVAPAQPAPAEPVPAAPADPAPVPEPPAAAGPVPAEPAPANPVPANPAPADPAPSPTAPAPADDGAAVVPGPASTPPAGLADTGGNARDAADGGNLAYTGANALPAAGAAAAAIAAGAVLMLLVRRRRQRTRD